MKPYKEVFIMLAG